MQKVNVMKINTLISLLVFTLFFFGLSLESKAQEVSDLKGDKFETKHTAIELNNAPVKLIPFPKQVDWVNKSMGLEAIGIENSDAIPELLRNEIDQICTEKKLEISEGAKFSISFSNNPKLSDEGYTLKVSKSGVNIEASTETGFYYALQTLRQLIAKENNTNLIHLCQIEDEPKYAIRGFMIDVGRNFQSIELLKEQLDIMAKYKLNTFHWHLTDRPAWRVESKMYPELTDAKYHRPSRNPGEFYTYDEIRDLIKYAADRKIQVIPEIDMPGHSDSFIRSMGCKMESPKGMEILENILKEFFAEIPKEMAPIFHIGSDEVKIKNREEFITKMVGVVEAHGRQVVVWSPGLEAPKSVTLQTWGREKKMHKEIVGYNEIDSKYSYVNDFEPMGAVNQLLFRPLGQKSKNAILGGILCLWPDVNVWLEKDIYRQHPVYLSLLTYAWVSWTADVVSSPIHYQVNLPLQGTPEAEYFAQFETYLLEHKNKYFSNLPFYYYPQSKAQWQLLGPFDGNDGDSLVQNSNSTVEYKEKTLEWIEALGNTLTIKDRDTHMGYFPKAKAGQTVYARTNIFSDKDTIMQAHINFESPLRANRVYTGIAPNGSWDINGGEIWVNDELLKGPKWKNSGWKPFKQKGWATGIDKEIPWMDEELYWLRKPANISLKKGWNTIYVKIPCTVKHQNWMFTFVPLSMEGIRFSTKID